MLYPMGGVPGPLFHASGELSCPAHIPERSSAMEPLQSLSLGSWGLHTIPGEEGGFYVAQRSQPLSP